MRFKQVSILLFWCYFILGSAYAHPGGHGANKVLSEKEIKQHAFFSIVQLSKQGRVDETWQEGYRLEKFEKFPIQGKEAWRITASNSKVPLPQKDIIYLFIAPNGYFIGASRKENPFKRTPQAPPKESASPTK